jgi:glycosyltransferase involved in cell wall biosynthesis
VAKDQNVRLRSGWFSERDACYLASGKPVIAQDTGFSNILPTGEGLFAFTNMEQALAAIEAINGDYSRHCKAARAIAEEYFEASKVASRFLADIGLN